MGPHKFREPSEDLADGEESLETFEQLLALGETLDQAIRDAEKKGLFLPTPEHIRKESAKIRRGWDEEEERSRRTLHNARIPYEVPGAALWGENFDYGLTRQTRESVRAAYQQMVDEGRAVHSDDGFSKGMKSKKKAKDCEGSGEV